jgi:hypothetical protein
VEDSLQYFRAHCSEEFIPQEVQRDLLEGQLLSEHLVRKAELLGNRLAVTRLGDELLVCSPTGQTGECSKLAVLTAQDGTNPEVQAAFCAPYCTFVAGCYMIQPPLS